MKFCTKTLGCKVNQYDAQALERSLSEQGHELVAPGKGCDVCIVYTCAVTSESARKSWQAIRRMEKSEPNAKIEVRGCLAKLDEGLANLHGIVSPFSENRLYEEFPPGFPKNRTRALLKLQDGCDNFCAYCVVPFARGRSRSLPPECAAEYAKQLENRGFKEIVITGIEISSYGKDLSQAEESPGRYPLSFLIKTIKAIRDAAPNARIRLGSLEPSSVTDEFCRELSKIPDICDHFHLSLQSGCDETLLRMGRKYKTSSVMRSITTLRELFPDCGITADLITGFPGENDNEFGQTLSFIRKAAFSDMHVFPYSPRPLTKAADMPGQVEKSIRKERARIVAEVAESMAGDFKTAQIGKIAKVLVEREKNGFSVGHSSNYLEIHINGKLHRNTVQKTRIISVDKGLIMGEII